MAEALARSPPPGLKLGDPVDRVITWVPLGSRRKRSRGFDQAEALARPVAAILGWPARPLLGRRVETAPQARRSGPERRLALEGVFVARGTSPPAVVLVDDVLTTGATAAVCASVLVASGCREVGVLTAARALNGRLPVRCYTPAPVGPAGSAPPASRR
jgi:predicted amidophosphoribosyltransferase